MTTIVRAQIVHTPRNPFADGPGALEAFSDGGLAYDGDGRILATGSFADVRTAHPDAHVVDASDAVLVPGLVDLHVHYPQIAVIGAMGMTLLEWLATRTLPEEVKLADAAYAEEVASVVVRLPRHVRALRPRRPPLRLRPRRSRVRRRAHPACGGGRERGALPVEQRVPRERHLPDAAPLRPRCPLRPRHRRRSRHRAELFKEGLMAYHVQMVREGGALIGPAHLLYLATMAGAEALGLEDEIGDLSPGRSADFLLLRPPADGTLGAVLRNSPSAEATLGALFTLAREE
jgi:cytosine/adenosine deaminase-related metal-dependent hydrolase